MYAQAHPENVAGFVAMNPVPPEETFIDAVKQVETKAEFASDALPSSMPYAVMFDEDCGGDTEFCARVLPVLTRVRRSLAAVGEGGRFVRAKGAEHNIFDVNPALVQKTINDVLNDAD